MAKDIFAQTFRQYRHEIGAWFLKKTRDPVLSEDLTQETFVRMAARNGEGEAIQLHRPYLYRIAHNLLVDHHRRNRYGETADTQDTETSDIEDSQPSPEAACAARDELRHMQAALMQLPLRTRQVFVQVRLDGQSYRQTADSLDISESAVQKHLAMALAHLAQAIRGCR
ncbi:MAG: RNA polymerase sigma factor [Asticcacaulis sp.]